MNKKLIGLPLAFIILSAQAEVIEGVVESIDPVTNVAKIRSANQDFMVNVYQTLPAVQTTLQSPEARTRIQSFDVPTEAIAQRTPAPVRNDCSELPVSANDLEALAGRSSNMVEFLKNIPQGSLQGFTLVRNSLSLQRGEADANGEGKVSDNWPRALRSSMDGKLTISFVCDPKNPTYGKVEIIHFDDATKEFKTMEIDFGHPSQPPVAPANRVHHNPESCVSCHSGSEINGKVSLKPNWPEYFFWSDCQDNRGIQFYGSADDNMGYGYRDRLSISSASANTGCSSEQDQAMIDREKAAFQNFRTTQANNECFNTLPWDQAANVREDSRAFYPYSNNAQDIGADGFQDYALRTNARFTDTYSHLMAERNAGLLKQGKDYDKIKYFIALEESGCWDSSDEAKLKTLMPNLTIDRTVNNPAPRGQDFSIEATAPVLNSYAKSIGINGKDWTMEFMEQSNPNYNAVMFYGSGQGDAKIFDVTAGNVMRDIASTDPTVAPVVNQNISRGITEVFGPRFSCIDDLGGAVAPSLQGNQELCTALRDANDRNIASFTEIPRDSTTACEDCETAATPSVPQDLASLAAQMVATYTADQIERGKALVQEGGKGACVTCHGPEADQLPTQFQFISSETDPNREESLAVLRSKPPEFIEKLNKRLLERKNMPPPPMGADMTDADREAVRAYMMSLVPVQ